MSHPAFVGALEYRSSRLQDGRRVRSSSLNVWQRSLGVSPTVTAANLASFLLHSTSSILFLVFLNAMQPFLISQLGETKKQGSLSGTLVFFDELLSMFLVLFWGSLADVTGTKVVAVLGYCFIAIALMAYTFAQVPWPDLLFCRLTFAVGGSAVTAMLSGILNSYSASEEETVFSTSEEQQVQPTESSPLLERANETPTTKAKGNRHGRLAAVTGLMTGVGALIAVFFLLRLPTLLASVHDRNAPADLPDDGGDEAIQRGTKEAFYIVSALSLVVAVILAFGLKMDTPKNDELNTKGIRSNEDVNNEDEQRTSTAAASASARQARRQRLKKRLNVKSSASSRITAGTRNTFTGIFAGFGLARSDLSLTLGYLSGGLARACTIATTVFIPILVTRFFYTSGLCSTLPSPDIPPSELKRTCRQAFTIASILSGVIQLIALLLSPLIGYLCEALSPAITICIATTIGTISFLVLGVALPNDGDPRSPIAWIAGAGIGFCQIANIVASLALCAAHAKATSNPSLPRDIIDDNHDMMRRDRVNKSQKVRLGGSIAGAYSATGGLFILIISKLGGTLSDLYAPAAFLLLAFMAAVVSVVSIIVVYKERNSNTISSSSYVSAS